MISKHLYKFILSALAAVVGVAQAAPLMVTTTVDGHAGPWLQSLNPTFDYGLHDNLGPDFIDASNGFSFAPGGTFTLSYVSGCVTFGFGTGCTDATGNSIYLANDNGGSSGRGFPSRYMNPYPIYLVALVGTFADNDVIVGMPFALNDGPTTVTAPAGANQLLLGINDDQFDDNGGSLRVRIEGPSGSPSPVPEPGSFLLAAVGLGAAALWRLRVKAAHEQKGKSSC